MVSGDHHNGHGKLRKALAYPGNGVPRGIEVLVEVTADRTKSAFSALENCRIRSSAVFMSSLRCLE
jgi:hypothetical protein